MTRYLNLNGRSNILSYEIGPDSITVEFSSGRWRNYRYDHATTGRSVVDHMKALAIQGSGLNSYITKVAKASYSRKW